MNDYNAHLFLMAQAVMTRVEGMKAANKDAEQYEHICQPHDEADFEACACEIEGIAQSFNFNV